ncbi:hypothetical protein BC835DRAFT_134451 [Cytidiella melzeri]|nr:hypothetical protein BC835DRAFT_134451 [Cytidiella melzeri]
MRSASAVLVLAAAPAFAAPLLTSSNARRQDAPTSTDAESDAISLSTVGTIASFAVPVISEIADHFFGGSSHQRREFNEDLVRDELKKILGRQDTAEVDSSDAISLSTISDIGSIASVAIPVISEIAGHFFGGSSHQRRRDFEDVLREELHKLFGRQDSVDTDASGAISLSTIGTIASFAAPVIGEIADHFFGRRSDIEDHERVELQKIYGRQDTDDADASDAISLSTIGTIASFAAPVISEIAVHFFGGNSNRRRSDIEDLVRDELKKISGRQDTADADASDAISLSTIGTIASFAVPVLSEVADHFFGGDSKQRRELEELLARFDDSNDALHGFEHGVGAREFGDSLDALD